MLPLIRHAAPAALGLLLSGAAPAVAGSYAYTAIDFGQGTSNTIVTGVNRAGVVTGSYTGTDGLPHGFTWSAGTFTPFDAVNAPDPSTLPVGIDRRGQVLENYSPHLSGNQSAFVRNPNGTQHQLAFPASATVYAAAINPSGAIVGTVIPANAPRIGFLKAGRNVMLFKGLAATTSTADVIGDSGLVAGTFTDATGAGAYTYLNGTYRIFRAPNGLPLTPTAIDPAGLVFGSYLYESDNGLDAYEVGFTFDGLVFRSFRSAVDINTSIAAAFGTGYYIGTVGATGLSFGYVVRNGTSIRILPPGAVMSSVAGGTASGIIVGNYVDGQNVAHGFMAVCPAAQAPCTE